ncbi:MULTISPECIES: tripartite tricarboxylate transporter substrate binding protein [unclassified Xanthobacter]|uniref:tripartite tricarboxylate transporter substrate binding protein n=1 Tax=unclassified Xanthobacter TaxID=2623496 RepID=UPI001EDCFC3A|nr:MULTISPECIES: tripartite tricarboxylate transporter substrate binding protein [unclassified Xanthobacter]
MSKSTFTRRTAAGLLAAACGGLLGVGPALAQGYPDKEVRLVVPFSAGGSTDQLARILAEKLSDKLGKRVLVDNVPGAGGNIGMGMVARAAPDGYTLILVSSSFVVNPSLYAKTPYDPKADFAPISYIASAPSFLIANPKLGVKTFPEFLAKAKAEPGMFYASPGIGTAQHLAGELLKKQAQIDIEHAPFNGAGPGVTAVLSNEAPIGFASVPSAIQHVQSGALVALGVTTLEPSASAPDVPPLDKAGLPGYEVDHLQGLLAPAGTPPEVIAKLSTAVQEIMADPQMKERLVKLGFVPVGSTPAAFATTIDTQVAKWKGVISSAGITAK